jgi:hypothetical protein
MKLVVGSITKTHESNGIGFITIPISVVDDKDVVITTKVLTRSVNFSMFEDNAETIFKQNPEESMRDLVLTVKKEIDPELDDMSYNKKQESKLDLFSEKRFITELKNLMAVDVVGNDLSVLPLLGGTRAVTEKVMESTEGPSPDKIGIVSKIYNSISGIFRG